MLVDNQEDSLLYTRFSVGEHYELYPPLRVGYFHGIWFGMEFLDPSAYHVFMPDL